MNDSPMYTQYTLCMIARSAPPGYDLGIRTPNMLLLWCSLIRIGGLLDVDDKFGFGLIPIYGTRWVVHFVVLQVIARALPVRPTRCLVHQNKTVYMYLTSQDWPSIEVFGGETMRVVGVAVSRPGHCVRSAELIQESARDRRHNTGVSVRFPCAYAPRSDLALPGVCSHIPSLFSLVPEIHHNVLYVACVGSEGNTARALQVRRRFWNSHGVDCIYVARLQSEEGPLDYANNGPRWLHSYFHVRTGNVAGQTAEVEGRPH